MTLDVYHFLENGKSDHLKGDDKYHVRLTNFSLLLLLMSHERLNSQLNSFTVLIVMQLSKFPALFQFYSVYRGTKEHSYRISAGSMEKFSY